MGRGCTEGSAPSPKNHVAESQLSGDGENHRGTPVRENELRYEVPSGSNGLDPESKPRKN